MSDTPDNYHNGGSVRRTMLWICLCLLPGTICYAWYFGAGVILQCLMAIIFALLIETVCLKARKQDLCLFLSDGSVIVTAIIFALMITPYTPWWINLMGMGFGLVFAKHIYGGLGNNLFNPAVAAFVFILLCFPDYMGHWPQPAQQTLNEESVNQAITYIFSSTDSHSTSANYDTGNTAIPLADIQPDSQQNDTNKVKPWQWLSLFFLLGGLGLIFKDIISWHIPVAMFSSLYVLNQALNIFNPELYSGGVIHVLSWGTVLAAFFIATDPVTSPTTATGKLIYGVIIGCLIMSIRTWGANPDSIAFAILIANAMAPMIDDHFRPTVISQSPPTPDFR